MVSSSTHRTVATFAAVASVLLLSSCGVMNGGRTKLIAVSSTPAAATVTTQPATGQFVTPTTLVLSRKNAYTLIVRKEGYLQSNFRIRKVRRQGILISDIVLGMFTVFVPVIVDASTGGWWDLLPDNPTITLTKADDSVEGPDLITVTLSTEKGPSTGVFDVTSAEPVEIQVVRN
jgi:hypothetical protein